MSDFAFDIFPNKVEKKPIPLLIVGLGGTGCDALRTIKETFAKRFILPRDENGQEGSAPSNTAYLGIDSWAQRPDGLEISEYVDISLPGIDRILQDQQKYLTPFERTWVDPRLCHHDGCFVSRRQVNRFMLSRNYEKVNWAIKTALTNIVTSKADRDGCQVQIVIITGIGGGTGSGIFLDICQILRETARLTIKNPIWLNGYIIMPDVSLRNVGAASGMGDPIKHNAYAALKELDFWMRVWKHGVSYTMEYGNEYKTRIDWKEPPFDTCYLMSSTNVEGINYKNGYHTVLNTIAENLLHNLAKEEGDRWLNYQYVYNPYADILPAIQVQKRYPLFYGYRAIGAFTKQIPKQPILYYEGSLLLDTFIPILDDNGNLQPDRRMFKDGQGKPRAESITGNGKQLLQDFRTNVCKLPSFCYLDLNDKVKVTSVQNMNPPPHNKWHNWRDSVSAPAALKTSEEYLKKAWKRFSEFAAGVITDPEQGPFALEAYLDAPDGLLSYMNEILASWTNQFTKIRNQSIRQGEEMCETSWGNFRNPPIEERKDALEQYDHAIKTLYTYVNNCEFLEKHVEALEKLILRVKEYLRDGLKPMCALILFLKVEFIRKKQSDEILVQDIYSLDTVQASIDAAFKEANANDKMSSEFLSKISDIALETQPNGNAKTSGVEFVCRQTGLNKMCKVLQADMAEVYGDVNNQSLDAIMVANVGEDVAAQQKWMDNLASSALDSALPMFMQDAAFRNDNKASCSYISIPQNAAEHLKYIAEAFKTHDPVVDSKATAFEDHIYVLNIWDKLPLFRYGLFEELRSAYDHDLKLQGSEGLHLVQSAEHGTDFHSDWSKLPSPKPYFLFTNNSVHSEMVQYEKVHDLVSRGIACGMITIDNTQPFIKGTVKVLYAANGIEPLDSESILRKKEEISTEKDPATGDVYPPGEIACRLSAFLNSGKTTVLEENGIRPANAAKALGLEHEPCDPFDPSVCCDIHQLEKAKINHKRLCTLMVEAMIYSRPDLVLALELQLPTHEEIANYIKSTNCEKRQALAERAAETFLKD